MKVPVKNRPLYDRIKYLPRQIENTRRKLAAIEAEARRYGLDHLLEDDAA